jgi:sugar lactone lactonase YvrE
VASIRWAYGSTLAVVLALSGCGASSGGTKDALAADGRGTDGVRADSGGVVSDTGDTDAGSPDSGTADMMVVESGIRDGAGERSISTEVGPALDLAGAEAPAGPDAPVDAPTGGQDSGLSEGSGQGCPLGYHDNGSGLCVPNGSEGLGSDGGPTGTDGVDGKDGGVAADGTAGTDSGSEARDAPEPTEGGMAADAQCVPDQACTPASACHVGKMSCGSAPACLDQGINVQDDTPCAGGTCQAGICAPARQVSVVSGDNQKAIITQALASPVVLKVTTASGGPASGVMVEVTAPPGAVATPSTGATDAQGLLTTSLRLGRRPGTQRFSVKAQGTPVAATVSATASEPTPGSILTLLNVSHTQGDSGIPGPGTVAATGRISGVAVASDGTVYAADFDHNRVLRLDLDGVATVVAGTGQAGTTGDGGPAVSATLNLPWGLALDQARHFLYVSDRGNVVRRVDLATGLISTVAGGGSAGAPNYGDGGAAILATLAGPTNLSIGPDGALYIADTGHSRIRAVDPASGVITSWMTGVDPYQCSTNPYGSLTGCDTHGCSMVWDAAGAVFASGSFCNPGNDYIQIVRRAASGAFFHVAGTLDGVAADGVQGVDANLPGGPLAMDPAGNLFVAASDESNNGRIRRIDGASGRVSTVAGAGTSGNTGDFGPATAASLAGPSGIAFDSSQHLYIAELDSSAVRLVWSVGSTTPPTATLSVASGDGQSSYVDQLPALPLAARLVDGTGTPLEGFHIAWDVVPLGGALYATDVKTDAKGIATVTARPGLSVGPFQFRAYFHDIHGNPIAGSPAAFTLNATAPPAGTSFTAVNTLHKKDQSSVAGVPGAGTMAANTDFWATAADSGGNVYLSLHQLEGQILKLTPSGYLSCIAGCTPDLDDCVGADCGDNGPATHARFGHVIRALTVDNVHGRLYVAPGFGGDRIRYIDLATGLVHLYAGGGTAPGPGYGDGGPATSANLKDASGLAVTSEGNLFLTDSNTFAMRMVDFATGIISTVVPALPSDPCTGLTPTTILWLAQSDTGSILAADSADNVYFSAVLCVASVAQNRIFRRSPAGRIDVIAGGGTSLGSEIPAPDADLSGCNEGIAVDAAGNVYCSDTANHLVRKVDTSGIVTNIAGNGTAGGPAPDYVPAKGIQLNSPAGISILPGGHLAVADSGNHSLLIFW